MGALLLRFTALRGGGEKPVSCHTRKNIRISEKTVRNITRYRKQQSLLENPMGDITLGISKAYGNPMGESRVTSL